MDWIESHRQCSFASHITLNGEVKVYGYASWYKIPLELFRIDDVHPAVFVFLLRLRFDAATKMEKRMVISRRGMAYMAYGLQSLAVYVACTHQYIYYPRSVNMKRIGNCTPSVQTISRSGKP